MSDEALRIGLVILNLLLMSGYLAVSRWLLDPASWSRFWRDFAEGYSYVRDPHGWHRRIGQAQNAKWAPRPGMADYGGVIIMHPAVECQLILRRADELEPGSRIGGRPYLVSPEVVQDPPPDGWPDITIPVLPRLRP